MEDDQNRQDLAEGQTALVAAALRYRQCIGLPLWATQDHATPDVTDFNCVKINGASSR